MKKLIALLCVLVLTGCATMQTEKPVQAAPTSPTQYKFAFDPWQSFFYQDDAKTMIIMLQVKTMEGAKIPTELKLNDKVLKIIYAYPELKNAEVKK